LQATNEMLVSEQFSVSHDLQATDKLEGSEKLSISDKFSVSQNLMATNRLSSTQALTESAHSDASAQNENSVPSAKTNTFESKASLPETFGESQREEHSTKAPQSAGTVESGQISSVPASIAVPEATSIDRSERTLTPRSTAPRETTVPTQELIQSEASDATKISEMPEDQEESEWDSGRKWIIGIVVSMAALIGIGAILCHREAEYLLGQEAQPIRIEAHANPEQGQEVNRDEVWDSTQDQLT
jgi:hypothetical protein